MGGARRTKNAAQIQLVFRDPRGNVNQYCRSAIVYSCKDCKFNFSACACVPWQGWVTVVMLQLKVDEEERNIKGLVATG